MWEFIPTMELLLQFDPTTVGNTVNGIHLQTLKNEYFNLCKRSKASSSTTFYCEDFDLEIPDLNKLEYRCIFPICSWKNIENAEELHPTAHCKQYHLTSFKIGEINVEI